MSLFQRIKTPFGDMADDDLAAPQDRTHAVGALLRERREELGFDLDAIGEALRIKPAYLVALEQGRAQDLPGATYAIGFIRSYAELLGLDSDRVLDSYKTESADVHARPDLSLPVPLDARSLPRGPILLVGVIVAACGYGTWYYLSTSERSRPERVAAVPEELQRAVQAEQPPSPAAAAPTVVIAQASPAGAPAPSPVPRLTSSLLAPQASPPPSGLAAGDQSGHGLVASPALAALPQPAATGPPASGDNTRATVPARLDAAADNAAGATGGKQIDIRATTDCWIQVRSSADQSIVFSRVLRAGETYHVPRAGLVLRTGNAGALALLVDGKPAPSIGGIGALRRNVALDPQALLAGTASRE